MGGIASVPAEVANRLTKASFEFGLRNVLAADLRERVSILRPSDIEFAAIYQPPRYLVGAAGERIEHGDLVMKGDDGLLYRARADELPPMVSDV